MANAAQVNIRLIENRRDWTFDFGAKWTVWKVENGRFAIGTSIIGHFLLKINTKIIFLQQSLVYILCAICWTLIFSLFYSIFFFVWFQISTTNLSKGLSKTNWPPQNGMLHYELKHAKSDQSIYIVNII